MRTCIARWPPSPIVQIGWSPLMSLNSAGTERSAPVTVIGPDTLIEATPSSPVPMLWNTRPFTLRTMSVTSS